MFFYRKWYNNHGMKLKVKNYFLALCSAITLLFNWKEVYFKGLKAIFDYKLILVFILSLIINFVFNWFNDEKTKYSKILSLIFTGFILVGNSYINYGTIIGLYRVDMLLWSLIKAIGYYQLLLYIINYLQKNINKLQARKDIKDNWFVKVFNKHPLITCLSVLAVSWSIYYIAFYPIVLSPDPSYQIKQFLGERTKYSDYSLQIDESVTVTNHHPVFHTFLIGSFTKLGVSLGNVNVGLFLYSLIQGTFMALTLSYTICLLKKKKIKGKYLFLMLGIYSLVPMFPLYAINGNKDVYYSMFVLWLFMLIFKYLDSSKEEKLNIKQCLSWFLVLMSFNKYLSSAYYVPGTI